MVSSLSEGSPGASVVRVIQIRWSVEYNWCSCVIPVAEAITSPNWTRGDRTTGYAILTFIWIVLPCLPARMPLSWREEPWIGNLINSLGVRCWQWSAVALLGPIYTCPPVGYTLDILDLEPVADVPCLWVSQAHSLVSSSLIRETT